MTTFKRFDFDDGHGYTDTYAGEIMSVAAELVFESHDLDRKNSMRGVQTPKSERSLKDRLEALIARERAEHPDPAEDILAAAAHAHDLSLSDLQSSSTNFEVVRCRIEAARTAVFSTGAPTFEVARILKEDHNLVKHWIVTAHGSDN
jgi:hypothetical protein